MKRIQSFKSIFKERSMFKKKSLSLVTLALLGAGTLALSGCSNSSSALEVHEQVDLSVPAQSIANQEVDFLAEIQNQGMSALGAAMTNNSADTITIDSVTYPTPIGRVTIDPLATGDIPAGDALCYDFNSNTGATLAPSQSCYFGFKAKGYEGDTLTGDVVVNVSGGITQTYTIPVNTTFVGQNDLRLPTARIGTVNIAPDYTTVITVQNEGADDLSNVVLTLPEWLVGVIDTDQPKNLRIASIKAGESADFSFTLQGQEARDALNDANNLADLNNNPSTQLISINAANLQGGTVYPVVSASLTSLFATNVYFTEPGDQNITITNVGTVSLAYLNTTSMLPTGITLDDTGCKDQILSTNDSCEIKVTASAAATDIAPISVAINFTDEATGGVFPTSSQIQVAPVSVTMAVQPSIDKPLVGGDINTGTITMTNTGNFNLVPTASRANDPSGNLGNAVSINPAVSGVMLMDGSDNSCYATDSLAPNTSCEILISVTDQAPVGGENPIVLDATQLANYIGADIGYSFTIAGQAGHISIEQNGQGIESATVQASDSSEEIITVRNVGHQALIFGANPFDIQWQSATGNLPTITNDNCANQTLTAKTGTCTFTLQGAEDENITEPQTATLTITSTNGEPLSSTIAVVVEPASGAFLPQTGETSTAPIDPAPAYSDGAVEAGVKWDIADRFVANDTVVTDTLTGLQWQKDPSVNNSNSTVDWNTALSTCNNYTVTIDGTVYDDWRLPNVLELASLIDLAAANPASALNGNGFSRVLGVGGYWTSSTYAPSTGRAWVVRFSVGSVDDVGKTYGGNYRAWCVRSGL
jgi:hypothetical protein